MKMGRPAPRLSTLIPDRHRVVTQPMFLFAARDEGYLAGPHSRF
jgi:hypothetical protein